MATTFTTSQSCAYIPPDGGERFHIFDDEVAVKVTGAESNDAYAVVSIAIAPGGGPPLHAHAGAETFIVLAGEFTFTQHDAQGVSTFHASRGATVHAPGGVPHRFENAGTAPGMLLIVCEPETLDFLRETGKTFPRGAEPDMETMLGLSSKYGIESIYDSEGSRPEPPRNGTTSARARALAWRFSQANDALIEFVERCTPGQWQAVCADTGWTVAVQAHHVADNHAHLAGTLRQAAEEQPPRPMTPEALDDVNARHAEAFANVSLAETVALLRRNGAIAAQTYRCMSDQQLARTAALLDGAPSSTVADLIAYLAIGEIERHGQAIREAIGKQS